MPLAGATLAFYLAGTTTKITIYQDTDATTPSTNPVVADATGTFPSVFVAYVGAIKFILKDADGVTIQTVDGLDATSISDGSVTDAKVFDPSDPADGIKSTKIGYLRSSINAVTRSARDKMDDFISVKDFASDIGAGQDATDAFKFARDALITGNEYQGGTIRVPTGRYKLSDSLIFDDIDSVTGFWIEGEGALNTELDFEDAGVNKDGIVFRGGSLCGVKKLFIVNVPRHGIVLNDSFDSFVSQAKLSELRIQNCGADGVYSKNSYLISLDDIWSANNGNIGFNFVGNHTSIISNRIYASGNESIGIRVNGAVYIDMNWQSDNNLRAAQLSNIRGGIIRAPGSENNRAEGILLRSGNDTVANIIAEYQDIAGLTIIGGYAIRNNTDGPVGNSGNSIVAVSADNRPIEFTLIGNTDFVTVGDPSVVIAGVSGKITVREIGNKFDGPFVVTGNSERQNHSLTGRRALVEKAANQSIANSSAVTLTWDALTTANNDLGATLSSSTGLVIPAGVSKVRVSAGVVWASSASGARYLAIYKNGTNVRGLPQDRRSAVSSTLFMTITSAAIPVVAGDVLTVVAIQDSGGAINIEGSTACWFEVEAVS